MYCYNTIVKVSALPGNRHRHWIRLSLLPTPLLLLKGVVFIFFSICIWSWLFPTCAVVVKANPNRINNASYFFNFFVWSCLKIILIIYYDFKSGRFGHRPRCSAAVGGHSNRNMVNGVFICTQFLIYFEMISALLFVLTMKRLIISFSSGKRQSNFIFFKAWIYIRL